MFRRTCLPDLSEYYYNNSKEEPFLMEPPYVYQFGLIFFW